MPEKANLVIDVKEVQRNIEALPGVLPDRVIQFGLKAAADVAKQRAQQPGFAFNDRTGMARKSIRTGVATRKVRNRGTTRLAKLSIGKTGARHGVLLEVGTDSMKARTPIRRSVEETISQAWRACVVAMKKRFTKLEDDAKKGKITKADLKAALTQRGQ